MAAQKVEDKQWSVLRRKAEKLVGLPSSEIDHQLGREVTRLIHEIQVNQAELEMQNEELAETRDTAEAARRKYETLYRNFASLFNFAPIGYLIINRDGVIHEINLAASVLLDAPRSALTGRCITDFIHRDDQDGFYYQKLNCRKHLENSIFELKMKKADGRLFDAQLQLQSFLDAHSDERHYTVSIVDVSEQVQLSSSFTVQQQSLELASGATTMAALLDGYVQLVKSYLQCDAVGIRIRDEAGNIPYQAYDGFSQAFYESESPLSLYTDQCMCIAVINGTIDPALPFFTQNGSFYINGTSRFLATVSPTDLGATRNVCNAHGYESVVLVPIGIGETIEGLIHAADHRENRFPLRVVENLENLGSRLGMAIQRFHLQKKLGDSIDALNDLTSHLLTVQEDEQRRIAMELHDGCGQDLNVLKLRLKSIQKRLPADAADLNQACDELLTFSDKIIDEIRNIAHGLKPAALETLGLSAATRQMIREYSTYANVEVEANIELLDQIKDSKAQICLFRIFQEALTNVHKHAQATWVVLVAIRDGDAIRIRIEDNGMGFDAQKEFYRANGHAGMGLSALALRCRMIGADLTVDSQAGKGCRLVIRVPCSHPEAVR
ncbi:histidine kinase [uncultured Desulfosarcina sp.]|uniref:PAS domain-containing sensor histidine kinase n=1 Tax=uncultured Desulfosarcina sp. TaxID=218289 RepID=UPI0029C91098|nr:histidine kinase [uncultured Desulfosarcina sp.]